MTDFLSIPGWEPEKTDYDFYIKQLCESLGCTSSTKL